MGKTTEKVQGYRVKQKQQEVTDEMLFTKVKQEQGLYHRSRQAREHYEYIVTLNDTIMHRLVSSYLNFIKETVTQLSGVEVVEVFRYSLCSLLGLDSVGFTQGVELTSKAVVSALEPIRLEYALDTWAEERKWGLLTCCMKCMNTVKQRAGV